VSNNLFTHLSSWQYSILRNTEVDQVPLMCSSQAELRPLPLFVDHRMMLHYLIIPFFSGRNLEETPLKLQKAPRILWFSANLGVSLTSCFYWDTFEAFDFGGHVEQGLVKIMF